MRFAALDISTGVISGNLIAYAIIASTAATLFVHHKSIVTAVDAAQSLVPYLGHLLNTCLPLVSLEQESLLFLYC